MLDKNAKTLLDNLTNKAIVFTGNQNIFNQIDENLKEIGWKVIQKIPGTDQIIEEIKKNPIDMLVIGSQLLNVIISMPLATRRKIFVVLLDDTVETNNEKQAFSNSVDLVLNTKDIELFKDIIEKRISEYNLFYKTFSETLVNEGKY